MESLKMNNGRSIPIIGLGTWNSPPGEVGVAVKKALEVGYRHLDCAYVYRNEAEIGGALECSLKSLNLKREDVFVTSKLWNTFFRPEHVRKACEETLKNLRLKYLDLYLIHWPVPFQEMEKLVDDGLVKSIGLSNFNKRQIENILKHCRIKPANLQIEIHANFPNIQLVEYAQSIGLTVTAYAPLGSPAASPGRVDLLMEPWVLQIAKHHGKTPAQVLLRYLIQRNLIIVPKSVTPKRIEENFGVFDFQLSKEEMHELNTKGLNERQFKLLKMANHSEYPFKDAY
ncbi:aldo-keto reductase, putative [Schistosoma mansoni]|uniref:aldo-keto reductase, putative n=1 Tax=Schistosoma mansoni TaxID=6183 RepID=UPI0001A63504|nr:aldo-keto reductase, putative [Schistosoma mansoni]|eukprot:XP_018646060.1 aldo-keto reductase, putative [Schistosoma mansoni]